MLPQQLIKIYASIGHEKVHFKRLISLCPFLLCAILFFIQLPLTVSASGKPTYYRHEYKQKRREVRKLRSLKQMQERKMSRFQHKQFNKTALTEKNIAKFQNRPKRIEHWHRVSNERKAYRQHRSDSVYLKRKIAEYTQESKQLQEAIALQTLMFKESTAALFQLKSIGAMGHRHILKAQKEAYYLKERMAQEQAKLMPSVKTLSFQNQLTQARTQQQQLLSNLKQGAGKLPAAYQTKARVQASLPAGNKQGSQQQAAMLAQKIQEYQRLTDSLAKLPAKDSLWFKPNPYKALLFRQRLKPLFSWQTAQAANYYPARIDFMAGCRFLLSPRVQPLLSMSYKLGLGTSLQNIQLSTVGYACQAGVQIRLYKKIFIQGSAEMNFYRMPAETNKNYQHYPGFVLGIGMAGKPGVFAGFDCMAHSNPGAASPFVIRFNF